MKIAFVTQWYPPEKGSAALPGVIAGALAARGLKVKVVTAFPNYPEGRLQDGWVQRWNHREQDGDVEVLRAPVYLSHDHRPLHRMLNYLSFACSSTITLLRNSRGVEKTWVFCTPATTAIPAMLLKALKGTPYVLHIQDLWPDTVLASGMLRGAGARFVRRPLEWFCSLSYRHADVIGIIAPGMRRMLVARGVPDEKIVDIPNWADESIFTPGVDGNTAREDLGLPEGFIVMYAGSVGEFQGLDTLIEAAMILRARTDICIAIVGDGVAKQDLQEKVNHLGLSNVTFIESQPIEAMASVLAAADLQLISLKDLPHYRITLPSKTQATMAAGRPIIVSAGGDAGDVVRGAGAGLAVEPENAKALADGIVTAADASTAVREGWARSARSYYEGHFSEDQGVTKMVAALRRTPGLTEVTT